MTNLHEKATYNIEWATHDIEKATHDIEWATHDIEKATHDIEKATHNIEWATHGAFLFKHKINDAHAETPNNTSAACTPPQPTNGDTPTTDPSPYCAAYQRVVRLVKGFSFLCSA